jgi:hypothetical protein
MSSLTEVYFLQLKRVSYLRLLIQIGLGITEGIVCCQTFDCQFFGRRKKVVERILAHADFAVVHEVEDGSEFLLFGRKIRFVTQKLKQLEVPPKYLIE